LSAVVVLPRSLVALFPGAERRTTVDGATVLEIVEALERRHPGLRDRLVEAGPRIREHVNLFVDGEPATLATSVADGATVHVIPAVSGG
jgi:molybdopterin converting factor small subunit